MNCANTRGFDVPLGWTSKKLKYVASLRSGETIGPQAIEDEGNYPVFGGNGRRGFTSEFTHSGDYVLIGRQGALCGNVNYASGQFWASEHAIVVDPRGDANVRWLGELLGSMNLNQYSQSAAQPGLAVDFIANLEIPVPPETEQLGIAAFLERKTGHIDRLVAAKQRLLELLAEKRRALITHAVTRGLDPNAPLRDSGLPWLGHIPAHWSLERLRFHLSGIEQGWSPQCDNAPADDGEWGVMRAGCVNGWDFDPTENKRLPDSLEPIPAYEIQSGDVLMSRANTTALLGSTALVGPIRPKLMLCDKLYRLNVDEARLSKSYLVTFLKSAAGRHEFERDASGASSSMQNIGQDSVRNVSLPVPPMNEQLEVDSHVRMQTKRLDDIRSATEHTITLLKERRAALIAAAVTGQLVFQEPTSTRTA